MKKVLSLLLVVFMLLPIFAVTPVSAADSGSGVSASTASTTATAKKTPMSFVDPVNAGSDKYYPTKTLQTVDFTEITSVAGLAEAGITYLDADAGDSYDLSFLEDGLGIYSSSDKGYLLSSVNMSDSTKSYIVDFTFRHNGNIHILEASAAFADNTTISSTVGDVVDLAAYKLRLKRANDSNNALSSDGNLYYVASDCSGEGTALPGTETQDEAYVEKADVRVRLLITDGKWQYGELRVNRTTYYIKANNAISSQNGYFGFRFVGNSKAVFKNLTISECARDATASATVVSGGNSYRHAAGTVINYEVYDKTAIAIDGGDTLSYASASVTAVAGKTYTILGQAESSKLFISPMSNGTDKYYSTKIHQAIDFTKIKSDKDFAAAGMTYLDADETDAYGISYVEDGLRFSSNTNKGYLLSGVKMSSLYSYIVDFTLRVDPSAELFAASAVFANDTAPNSSVLSTVSGKSFKFRMHPNNKLALEGANFYTDSTYTQSIGKQPSTEAQEAAITEQKDIRVRMLFVSGKWQYAEIIVDGQTYYVKADAEKASQTKYFGFASTSGEMNVVFKNLTITECVKGRTTHSFIRSGDYIYRTNAAQTLTLENCKVLDKNPLVIKCGEEYYTESAYTVDGAVYTLVSVGDLEIQSMGASARLKTDSGLRFASAIDKKSIGFLDGLEKAGLIKSYSYGTLITLAKYASEINNNVTHEKLDAFAAKKGIKNAYVDVEVTGWYTQTEDSYIFVGSIVNIKDKNYTREYASVGYLTVTMADDSVLTVYADYSDVKARSVSYVAACALCDETVSYDETQTKILNAFIGGRSYYPLLLEGVSGYSVVYPNGDATAKALATELVDAFAKAGVSVPLLSDSESVSGKAIYVGNTTHSLSAAGASYYINAEIACDASGNMAITGTSNDAIAGAVRALADKINSIAGTLTKTLLFEGSKPSYYTAYGFGNAPKYTGTGTVELQYSFEKSNSYYILVHNANATSYDDYIATLEAEGYTCQYSYKSDHKATYRKGTYSFSSTSTSNSATYFATYTDGHNIVTVSYIAYTDSGVKFDSNYPNANNGNVKYISIAIDCVENSALPERSVGLPAITTEQITTIDSQCGYVLRLQDGRFVIFDGGQVAAHATRIYEILTEQNVLEGKPVVAAWFLTHGHSDHIGALLYFTETYSQKVEVENFVHNLPAYDVYNGKNTAEGDADNQASVVANLYNRSNLYYSDIEKYYPNSNIIVAHAGQRFTYGDLNIDVLFTTENLYKERMYDTNASSVAYSITGTSGRMIILGDMVEPAGGVLNAMYGTTLKCDLVQVAHHGANNGNPDMYKSMNADYAIWTQTKENFTGYGNAESRNFFDHTSVDSNLIPFTSADVITLTENMTAAEIKALNADLTGFVSAGSKKYSWD